MNLETLLGALSLGAVVLFCFLDLQAIERRVRTRRGRARRASDERRCPFCHQEFDEGEDGEDT